MSTSRGKSRIEVRVSEERKRSIRAAAAACGQSVRKFTASAVMRRTRQVLAETRVTRLSNRDRDTVLAVLDDADAQPNDALQAAATRYRERAAT